MYLRLYEENYDEFPFSSYTTEMDCCYYYPLMPSGHELQSQWLRTPSCEDEVLSGVFADWCDEHRDHLLSGATGPSDPAVRLDRLIDWLRRRCTHPQEV